MQRTALPKVLLALLVFITVTITLLEKLAWDKLIPLLAKSGLKKAISQISRGQVQAAELIAGLSLAALVGLIVFVQRRRDQRQLAFNRQLAGKAKVWLVRPSTEGKANLIKEAGDLFLRVPNILSNATHLSFEIVATADGVGFYVWASAELGDALAGQIRAHFPGAQIEPVTDDPLGCSEAVQWVELVLQRNAIYPIRYEFEVDPLATLLQTLTVKPGMSPIGIQFIARPAGRAWRQRAAREVNRQRARLNPAAQPGQKKKVVVTTDADRESLRDLEAKKDATSGYDVVVRLFGFGSEQSITERLVRVFGQFAGQNHFVPKRPANEIEPLRERWFPRSALDKTVLHAGEIAALWHVPGKELASVGAIFWSRSRQLYPQSVVVRREGEVCRRLGLSRAADGKPVEIAWRYGFDTNTHGYALGPTGVGKSTLLLNWVLDDIYNGHGVLVLEPHGDLTNDILTRIPPEREADVVLLDPADRERPFGLNILDKAGGDISLVSAQVMGIFQKVMGSNWDSAVRMQRIIRNSVAALLAGEESPSLYHLFLFFSEEGYRDEVLTRVTDDVTRRFWTREFSQWGDSEKVGAMGPPMTRVERFLSNPIARLIITQPRSTINFRQLMDERRIVLVKNISGATVGEDNVALIGGIVIAKLWMAAASRRDTPEKDRRYFYAYVDEFQNYVTPDISTILAEARKFGLGFVMANQYMGQLPGYMQDAIDVNTRTKVAFRLTGTDDSRAMAKMMGGEVTDTDLMKLDKYEVYVRAMNGGATVPVFSARTVAPMPALGDEIPTRLEGRGTPPIPISQPALSGEQREVFRQIGQLPLDERAARLVELSNGDWDMFVDYRLASDRRKALALIEQPSQEPDRVKRLKTLSRLLYGTPAYQVSAQMGRLEKSAASNTLSVQLFDL